MYGEKTSMLLKFWKHRYNQKNIDFSSSSNQEALTLIPSKFYSRKNSKLRNMHKTWHKAFHKRKAVSTAWYRIKTRN